MTPLSVSSLRAAYASGSLTPTGLIRDLIARIESYDDPALWIHRVSAEALLAHARRVESRPREEQSLYGVPFAIKDNIDLAGVPTTAACPDFAYTPAESAPVVQRLIDAGAIPIGKVNLDQFATGLVGVRSPYGTPRNPFCADVIPGGSSSGSAVAVAAGLVAFALGTDTAGSGRVPAGLNNLVGLKPTRGALSTRGVVPACRSLDCVSIFAPTCDDAATVARIAEGYDADDPFSRVRPTARESGHCLRRIGVPAAGQLEFCGDAEAERLFHASLDRLSGLGLERVEIDFTPFREAASLLYQGPWIAERWAALREFHRDHADAFLPVTREIIERGRTPSAADAFDGTYRLAALARRAAAEWSKMDALLLPTAPRPYTLAEVAADPLLTNTRLGTYTNFVNLLDLSAIAVPVGLRSDGVPWGVTFVAGAWGEDGLFDIGRAWERGSDVKVGSSGGVVGSEAKVVGNSYFVVGEDRESLEAKKRDGTAVSSGNTSDSGVPSPTPNFQLPTASSQKPIIHSPIPNSPASVPLAVIGAHLSGMPLNHQLTDRGGRMVWSGRTA
ncbi:MAG TPA: allophanate hydrolase, partial [Opitutaceae bacterium]|nr:allophanate hydrolase [Opitutaceae bacterium]